MSQGATTSTPPERSAPPDWEVVTETIRCPLCDYDLRGLTKPRCPECGYRFDWRELLETRDRSHPYLFEFHPRRNIWSFTRTKLAGFLPWRFWRTLRPEMDGSRWRLILYWFIPLPLLLLMTVSGFARHYYGITTQLRQQRQQMLVNLQRYSTDPRVVATIQQYGSAQGFVDAQYPGPFSKRVFENVWREYWRRSSRTDSPSNISSILVIAAWPVLTFASLLIFRTTMHRAKVRSMHVLRCAIYSADVPIVTCTILIVLQTLEPDAVYNYPTPAAYWPSQWFGALPNWVAWGVVAAATMSLLTLINLGFAYRLYLRFPQPWLTAMLAQLVALVAALTIIGLVVRL